MDHDQINIGKVRKIMKFLNVLRLVIVVLDIMLAYLLWKKIIDINLETWGVVLLVHIIFGCVFVYVKNRK